MFFEQGLLITPSPLFFIPSLPSSELHKLKKKVKFFFTMICHSQNHSLSLTDWFFIIPGVTHLSSSRARCGRNPRLPSKISSSSGNVGCKGSSWSSRRTGFRSRARPCQDFHCQGLPTLIDLNFERRSASFLDFYPNYSCSFCPSRLLLLFWHIEESILN